MKPPGLEGVESFDDLSPWLQAKILAFWMILEYEEGEKYIQLLKIIAGVPRF